MDIGIAAIAVGAVRKYFERAINRVADAKADSIAQAVLQHIERIAHTDQDVTGYLQRIRADPSDEEAATALAARVDQACVAYPALRQALDAAVPRRGYGHPSGREPGRRSNRLQRGKHHDH